MRSILSVFTVLFAVIWLAGCDFADMGPQDQYHADFHYTLKPADRLSVDNFNGRVEVTGWDEPSIEITGTKYASRQSDLDAIKIDVQNSPSLVDVRTIHPDLWNGHYGVRYLIRAPRKTVIDRIGSSNGEVRLYDMMAPARIHTSNGQIRVEHVTGNINAETSNGAVELYSVTGDVNLKTSNGRIRAEDLTGQCEARTSNGPVTILFKDAPAGPTRLETSNGSVELTMPTSPKSGIRAETSNGSISLNLPAGTDAHLNAQTSHSSISSEFAVDGDRNDDKHHLEGNIGAGGPIIELNTHNGGIHLHKTTVN